MAERVEQGRDRFDPSDEARVRAWADIVEMTPGPNNHPFRPRRWRRNWCRDCGQHDLSWVHDDWR